MAINMNRTNSPWINKLDQMSGSFLYRHFQAVFPNKDVLVTVFNPDNPSPNDVGQEFSRLKSRVQKQGGFIVIPVEKVQKVPPINASIHIPEEKEHPKEKKQSSPAVQVTIDGKKRKIGSTVVSPEKRKIPLPQLELVEHAGGKRRPYSNNTKGGLFPPGDKKGGNEASLPYGR